MSKELEALDKIKEAFGCDPAYYGLNLEFEILHQALLKSQEQEKVLEILKSKAKFYDNNTKCKIEIEADDFNSSEEWEQVREVLGNES